MSHGWIMIGLQALTIICTCFIIYKWITAPKDQYDLILEKLMNEEKEEHNK